MSFAPCFFLTGYLILEDNLYVSRITNKKMFISFNSKKWSIASAAAQRGEQATGLEWSEMPLGRWKTVQNTFKMLKLSISEHIKPKK